MTDASELIYVAFGIDAGYAPHAATTIASIVANAPGRRFHFMIAQTDLSAGDRTKIESCAPGQTFSWPTITDPRMLAYQASGYLSRATLYRLSIPVFSPPEARRVIYLDADLVVLGDLGELNAVDLGGCMIGAVHDGGTGHDAFVKKWNLDAGHLAYFNSGVLVLDVEKIRAADAFTPVLELIAKHGSEFTFHDQDALNIVFWKKWKALEPLWNVQRRMVYNADCCATPEENMSWRKPKIIHFTESVKPWQKEGYHPFIWTYFRYLRRTPYWKDVNAKAGNTPIRAAGRYVKTALRMARLKA